MAKTKKENQGKNGKWIVIALSVIVLSALVSFIVFSKGISLSGFATKNQQEINMEVSASGYSPNIFTLKKGVPVKWNIDVKQLTGCNEELILNDYGLDINLKQGLNQIEFTPDKTGVIRWSCGMNMLQGSFLITETGEANQLQISEATPSKSGGCTCGGHA
ncbi:MAG: cupredoxin domain-containing protein [Candidatus Woesearchaeota archaeon]